MDNFGKINDFPEQKETKTGIKEVVCLSCHKNVEVKLVPYGTKGGHAAVCPNCKKLAYNGD